jgi:hypothetical protein
MGGSGGGYFRDIDPSEQASKVRSSEQKEKNAAYETMVNGYLSSELAVFNDRDSDTVTQILENLKSDLKDQVEGTVNLLFGGSISKHTYVDGLSDVDALVLFDRKDLIENTPQQLRNLLAKNLQERYGEKNIHVGRLAVTVKVKGLDIQLLPAQRLGDSFKISGSDGEKWSQIRPQKFAEALTKVNQKTNGKVIPSIKIAKAILGTLPAKQQLSGYHIESLSVNIFKNYAGPMTPKDMVTKFFESAATAVKSPIKDSSGQSVHVDDYLGSKDSTQRRVVSMALDRISRKIKNADGMMSVDSWKKILGE